MYRPRPKTRLLGHEAASEWVREHFDALEVLFPRNRVLRWAAKGHVPLDAWMAIINAMEATFSRLLDLHGISAGPARVLTIILARFGPEAFDLLAKDLDVSASTIRKWRERGAVPEYQIDVLRRAVQRRFDWSVPLETLKEDDHDR